MRQIPETARRSDWPRLVKSSVGALDRRTTAIEGVNETQDGRLDSIETLNTTQDGRLDALEGASSGGAVFAQQYSGMAYLYTDSRWVTFNANYGSGYYLINASAGTAADPTLNWYHRGPIMASGETLTQVALMGRIGWANIAGFDFRLYFQTGPWDDTWNSNGENTNTLVLDEAVDTSAGQFMKKAVFDLGTPFVAPADGFLVPYYKPSVTPGSQTHFLHEARLLIEPASA